MPKPAPDKSSAGYIIWHCAFVVMYPFVSVFTAVMAAILWFFSLLSSCIVWFLERIYRPKNS